MRITTPFVPTLNPTWKQLRKTHETKRGKLLEMVIEDSLEGEVDYESNVVDIAGSKLHPQV